MQTATPRRFHSLDALRGLAAIAVVLWHWRHFFRSPDDAARRIVNVASMPLYPILFPFYTSGVRAVDLFFCLSGFIFHWLYAGRISDGTTSGREFLALRFSRLYPLHLLALLLVLAGQVTAAHLAGGYFIYADNDVAHFVSHLVMAPPAALGDSFNGPAWSLSVEVLLYALFFYACRYLPSRALCAGLGIVAGLVLWPVYPLVARGLFGFFAGGATFLFYSALIRRGVNPALSVATLAALAWGATLAQMRAQWLDVSSDLGLLWASAGLFPVTVLALALLETRRGTLGKRVAVLGDISYSSYLLHFPLQLALLLGATALGIHARYGSAWLLLAFLVVLAALSLASYRCFEMPVQAALRERLAEARPTGRRAPAAPRSRGSRARTAW